MCVFWGRLKCPIGESPSMHRIEQHPILPIPDRPKVPFTWKGQALEALEGETLSSALFAAGVHIFGHHAKDGAPQGIFCANGQCSQCLVLADGVPVKSCMELVRPGVKGDPIVGVRVCRRSNPQQSVVLGAGLEGPADAKFSPDGRFIGWGTTDGTVMVAEMTEVFHRIEELRLGWH